MAAKSGNVWFALAVTQLFQMKVSIMSEHALVIGGRKAGLTGWLGSA